MIGGHESVVDHIHAELDDLGASPLIDIEAKAGSIQIVQPLPECDRLRLGAVPRRSTKGVNAVLVTVDS